MATVTEMEPVERVEHALEDDFTEEIQEEIPKKRGRGRPANNKSEEPDFWDSLNALGPKWDYTEVYVWRTGPEIDTTRGGKQPMYIKKYVGIPVDQDRIKQDCGSGGYKIRVNVKPPQGKESSFNPYYFEIYDLAFPPKVARGAWMDDSRNKKWGELMPPDEEKPAAQPVQQQQARNGLDDYVMRKLVDEAISRKPDSSVDDIKKTLSTVIGEANRQAWDMVKQNQSDPAQMFTMMVAILDKIAPKQGGSDPMMTILIEEMREARKEAAEARKSANDMMLEIVKQKNAPPAQSGIESMKGLLEVAGLLKEFSGGGGAASGLTGEIVTGVKELITPWSGALAPVVGQLVSYSAQRKHAEEMQKLHQQQTSGAGQTQHAPQAQPQQAQAQMQPNQPAAAEAPGQPQQAAPTIPDATIEIARFFAASIQGGFSGDQAAETFERRFGSDSYDQLIQTPKEQAMLLLKSIPQLWDILGPYEARLPQFIDEFYQYNEDDAPVSDAAPEPIAETKPAPKKGRKGGIVQ